MSTEYTWPLPWEPCHAPLIHLLEKQAKPISSGAVLRTSIHTPCKNKYWNDEIRESDIKKARHTTIQMTSPQNHDTSSEAFGHNRSITALLREAKWIPTSLRPKAAGLTAATPAIPGTPARPVGPTCTPGTALPCAASRPGVFVPCVLPRSTTPLSLANSGDPLTNLPTWDAQRFSIISRAR
eukprot:CAMPEP_0114314806 /NCGR_PEP_ID=MMETSP0059-20121206/22069_1 /TAXON_ID=36894 /ORGANISM="Pyramimonas parkeae, Strain CCMP726" /LENGTH=181 /DNA_ID=CAMNT_0001440101 /DNA_START=2202 /DNA_END=2747 /DNA_ORIENTATION=-